MMVVVADASPIHYLIQVGEARILLILYQRIVIPVEVFSELTAPAAPFEVRQWILQLPAWVEIRTAPSHDPKSMDLDPGEAAAVAIAELESEVLLLIDENAGTREATRRGSPNTGTLGGIAPCRNSGVTGPANGAREIAEHQFPSRPILAQRADRRRRCSQAAGGLINRIDCRLRSSPSLPMSTPSRNVLFRGQLAKGHVRFDVLAWGPTLAGDARPRRRSRLQKQSAQALH